MRCLDLNEVMAVSGGEGVVDDFVRDLLTAIVGGVVLFQGAAFAGGATGHIAGSLLGYNVAGSMGAGFAASCAVGFGTGIVGGIAGIYAGVYATAWLLEYGMDPI